MRRSTFFSITWAAKPKLETIQQFAAPQPRAAVLQLSYFSPCLRASVVGFVLLALFALPAIAQTTAPQLTADLAHSPGWVVISVDDYQTLRAHAFPAEHDPEPPPVDATLTRVDYDLNIAGELATGRASLTIDVLKDGWVRVPIPSGLLVREARLDGQAGFARLRRAREEQ
jgi:hypothetical protein